MPAAQANRCAMPSRTSSRSSTSSCPTRREPAASEPSARPSHRDSCAPQRELQMPLGSSQSGDVRGHARTTRAGAGSIWSDCVSGKALGRCSGRLDRRGTTGTHDRPLPRVPCTAPTRETSTPRTGSQRARTPLVWRRTETPAMCLDAGTAEVLGPASARRRQSGPQPLGRGPEHRRLAGQESASGAGSSPVECVANIHRRRPFSYNWGDAT